MEVNAILVLYHSELGPNAPTIMQHMSSFARFSKFPVIELNTYVGFPESLTKLRFTKIILHYSLFGVVPYALCDRFRAYLNDCEDSYTISFFQDEHRFWPHREQVIQDCRVDCVYTLVEPAEYSKTYGRRAPQCELVHSIPGYVDTELNEIAATCSIPDAQRKIDIGYRARRLPMTYGRGSQEKHLIAERFSELARGLDLRLDIAVGESCRIYGRAWYESFIANCRAMLGVESGVSIFDIENKIIPTCESIIQQNPEITFEELTEEYLGPHEEQIYYRTISPRHFEAAAFRVQQILFEGHYSGILEPMKHYLPLRKDFSNFDEVIQAFRDTELRREMTERAFQDLIQSGRHTYEEFIKNFDQHLVSKGQSLEFNPERVERAKDLLASDAEELRLIAIRRANSQRRSVRNIRRKAVRAITNPFKRLARRLQKQEQT